MTTAFVAGHGWHDGADFVLVPNGVRMGFYASPESPLDFAVMEEAVRRGDVAPLESFDPGAQIPNYLYAQFSDLEISRVIQANWHEIPLIFIEGQTRLCTDPALCNGPSRHTCDGLLGRAAVEGWDTLNILACRTNTAIEVAPTNELRDRDGHPTTEYYDEWTEWFRSFLVLPSDAQDRAWSEMPVQTQGVLCADLEVREWAECYWVRRELDASPGRSADILVRVNEAVKARLFRDYPAYAHLNSFNPMAYPGYAAWIDSFHKLDFQNKVAEWRMMGDDDKSKVLVDPGVSHFARLCKIWVYFRAGLEPAFLEKMLDELDPADRALLRSQPGFPAATPPTPLPFFAPAPEHGS
ncbi:putative adhesin [Streptomyces sp. NPDC001228]|uniref:putative adhesin n=1 Tax=Streptomyces sp. NPDC001228 TaxID=3154381 RepID=UPI003320C1CA